mmetsp:Transcript_120843/g.180515  ORF Transcript_120843/g.180515 Transcript_120843/m.180515 type:complete len:358 (+) Transcript_120843:192-1265(+)|eukprot:CAMPEP_0117070118 /NCGR_PEP_ID=MMETSP0472-20121206/49275_1 /TAXON_ID=693140 ORGANISM="Tiarina fusus, Strain LIS" /NCGR_SAMPLE_ID=MMETSP0472 /ASSEMBLY_ACC=CAM_ASM_000603 /LENGTH=357 /DNA_ID=CAMNT_0004793121 /DNA_START=54 /DNA_END=1127 /DNA_ORIENTATION=-
MVTTKTGGDSVRGNEDNGSVKPAPSKKRIVMTTKRRRPPKAGAAKVGMKRRAAGGLPSFRPRQTTEIISTTGSSVTTTALTDDPIFDDIELPSDCLFAIQNLHQSAQGLHIPITQTVPSSSSNSLGTTNNNMMMIQVFLEFQIFRRFEEHHASTIYQELVELKRNNVIRLLHCPDNACSTNTTWILTRDYVAGVWDSPLQQHEQRQQQQLQQPDSDAIHDILSWFVTNLKAWTESTLSESAMKESWSHKTISFETALQELLTLQVIMRDTSTATSQHTRYHLWLPKWGVVLKAWNEAREQLIAFVTLKKEISERNVLSKNRHSCVSTRFLLDELVYQGKLRIVERPFGRFVQKVKDG